MKVVSTEALTKLIQLVKSSFIKVDDVVQTQEVTLSTVATSGDYDDLINKPTIPTVNNATLTIQKNGSNVATFTANASSNVTANISVPTVDQTYSASSTNAQSGVAVASAISTKADSSTVSNINSRVTTIESEIPAQASASNQLADKNFVNSSIATNTANFIGTFNSVAELEAYTGAKDDNDYAFVISTDAAGNTLYNRYKWNGTAWLFEYALNNSSFTAAQWAAINSGATTTNIGQIATKADDNAVVHLSGNETITGVKTFKGNNRITRIQNSTVTYNTAPSSDTYTDISFRDKNGIEMGVLEHVRFTNNDTAIRLIAKGADGNYSTNLLVGKRADGTSYTEAPTPTAGDNSRNIATTAFVKTAVSNVLSALYPVGAIYIGTQSTCPLATLISGSTWELVAGGKALWGYDGYHNAGTTIEAGLPNIIGGFTLDTSGGIKVLRQDEVYGAFNLDDVSNSEGFLAAASTGSINLPRSRRVKIDASRSSSIYGNSTTVQPPAYVVNIWRRTA